MHELSIAKALIERLPALTPRGRMITTAHISVGPLQAIETEALQMAWRAVARLTAFKDVILEIHQLPYRWRCPQCGREWQTREMYSPCTCGNDRPEWEGGDELTIDTLEVEPKEMRHASPRG